MKGILSALVVFTLAGAAFAQQNQAYPSPAADPTVPTFTNAVVVSMDPAARTITVRADGRDSKIAVEGEALAGLSRLHPGDQVMLGYRVETRDGRAMRIVTNIRPVVPSAAVGAPARTTTIESVRVVAVNARKRTLTIGDGRSGRRVLSVAPAAAATLRQIRAGDDVVLSYRPGKARVVTRIEPVGVGAGGPATQVGQVSNVVPVTGTTPVTTAVPAAVPTSPVVVQPGPPVTGGIPLPPNAPGAPAVLQPVPNVGPPTSATVNAPLPPAGAGTMPENASPAQAEAIRAQGVLDLQSASSVLALKANEIDGLWFAFKDLCLGGTTPAGAATTTGREWFVLGGAALPAPTDDACRRRLADLQRAADLFQQQLSVAAGAARRADVLPGTIREVLQRNRLDR